MSRLLHSTYGKHGHSGCYIGQQGDMHIHSVDHAEAGVCPSYARFGSVPANTASAPWSRTSRWPVSEKSSSTIWSICRW